MPFARTISARNRDDVIPCANKLSCNGKTEPPATTSHQNAAHAFTPMFGRRNGLTFIHSCVSFCRSLPQEGSVQG